MVGMFRKIEKSSCGGVVVVDDSENETLCFLLSNRSALLNITFRDRGKIASGLDIGGAALSPLGLLSGCWPVGII